MNLIFVRRDAAERSKVAVLAWCVALAACGREGGDGRAVAGTGGQSGSESAGSAGTAGGESEGGSGGRQPDNSAGMASAGRGSAGRGAGGDGAQAGVGGGAGRDRGDAGQAIGGGGARADGGADAGGAAGTFDPSTPPEIEAVLNDCSLSASGAGEPIEVTLPSALTDANWGPKAAACELGGFDLAACAGGVATLYSFVQTVERSPGHPTTAWVIARGTSICCVYTSDEGGFGVSSVDCG